MNAIIPIKHPPASINLPAVVDAGAGFPALPKPIQLAIAKLIVAFPAGTQSTSEGDGKLRREVYVEAIDGFPSVVVMRVLKHLLLHNPSNPFAPTPQDVHEDV